MCARWAIGLGLVVGGAARVAAAEDAEDATPPVEEAATVDEAVVEARARAEEAKREMERDRQLIQFAAWQHVKAIRDMWRQLPAEYFPGLAQLVERVDRLQAEIEEEDVVQVGRIEPLQLTTKNPAFWRALLETTPDDPVVALFEQMLWAARGYFDRSSWLIDLQRYGPTLPMPVHRLTYGIGEEMGRLRSRQVTRRNSLLNNLPPAEIVQAVRAARSFQPHDLDWTLTSIVLRLRGGGVDLNRMTEQAEVVDELMAGMRSDWEIVAEQSPLTAARFHPQARMRQAAQGVDVVLQQLGESRGAYGERDLNRLAHALAEAGLYSEALQAARRAVGMRGFMLPGSLGEWWEWLPHLIGEEEAHTLRDEAARGAFRPVAFFQQGAELDGVAQLPLHPIIADRTVRRLQEAERRLSGNRSGVRDVAFARITQAETLGHLGRWDEAEAALAALPDEFADAGKPMQVWLSLWSGRLEHLDTEVAQLNPEDALTSPALPALAAAAQGRWQAGAEIFEAAADFADNDAELRAYYALMGAAFLRLAGEDDPADALIAQARELGQGHDWVEVLVRGMAGEGGSEPVGDNISEITEAGRVCEQRFYRAFQRDLGPERQRALLEGCVATGVVDFVEYTASLLRLRELEPETWDPTVAPPPESPDEPEGEPAQDWLKDASPSWSMPS